MKSRSRLGGTVFPHVNVSSRPAGTFSFIKYMCDIFKDCRKAFEEKGNKNRSQINELVTQYLVKNRTY